MISQFEIVRYTPNLINTWNTFVSRAKNSSFLFNRNYMDYHQNRFEDYSLLVFDEQKLIAVIPAHKKEEQLISHGGLSYGGIICLPSITLIEFETLFHRLLNYCKLQGLKTITINAIPFIYCNNTSEELSFIQFALNGTIQRVQLLSSINFQQAYQFNSNRKRMILKGKRNNFSIRQVSDVNEFWTEILQPRLALRYNNTPVHTISEMNRLMELFPNNIKQFNVYSSEGKILAGTTLFEHPNAIHLQYIAGTDEGNTAGALDFMIAELIETYQNKVQYFDFGSSHISNKTINKGLLYWKESFGARSIPQYTYTFDVKDSLSIFQQT